MLGPRLFGSTDETGRDIIFSEMPIIGPEQLRPFYHIHQDHVPAIPPRLLKAWNEEACPFWQGRQVKETHLLILIPKHGKNETINVSTILENAQIALPRSQQCLKPYLIEEIESFLRPCDESYWVLVTKKPVPGTARLSLEEQKAYIHERSNGQYAVVSTMEVTLSFLAAALYHVCLFGPDLNQYTRCTEKFEWISICTGGSHQGTVNISHALYFRPNGAAAARTS